jgi:hypothetical protein
MRRGVDVGIFDLDGAQVRMFDELDIRYHADADAAGDGQPHGLAAADLHDRIDGHAMAGEGGLQRPAGGRPAFAQHHAGPFQFLDADALTLGQRVGLVGEHDDLMAAVGHGEDAGVVLDMGQHGDVGGIVQEASDHLARIADGDGQADARIGLAEGAEHFRRMIGADGAHMQRARVEPAEGVQQVLGLAFQVHDAPGHGEKGPPCLGQLDPAPAAEEQLDLEHVLQRLDLAGQRRLAHVQHLRGGGETVLGGDGVEGSELCKYHRFSKWIIYDI